MWNGIISYMLFPFQVLDSYAKPALQWWRDNADDDTGEWGGICVFWAGPCVTQLCVLLLLLLLHIFSSSFSLCDRILLRRTAPTTRRDTQLDVERRSLLLSRLLSLLSAQSAHSSRCSCRLLIDQTLSALWDLLHVAGRVSSGRQQHGQTSCQDGPRPACQPVCVLAVLAAY